MHKRVCLFKAFANLVQPALDGSVGRLEVKHAQHTAVFGATVYFPIVVGNNRIACSAATHMASAIIPLQTEKAAQLDCAYISIGTPQLPRVTFNLQHVQWLQTRFC
jgi:hypothetical protein